MTTPENKASFSKYQVFIIAILAFIQFTIVLDFMVLSPLGAQLLEELNISTNQFGLVVSAYAFSAGIAGLLTAGFADKFDRKTLLLFFYSGFIIGTFLCGIAPNYPFLLLARIVTGLFGGVIGSISFAIITDLFKMETRGRVMGFVQTSFAASQVLGIPVGLYLANHFGWHAPFLMIVALCLVVGVAILIKMKPVNAHLQIQSDRNAFEHLFKTLTHKPYLRAFSATVLLATGGFMMMPFGSAFSINNLKISMNDLPLLYGITGAFAIVFGPLIGKWSDQFGKFSIFMIGSILTSVIVTIYSNMGPTAFGIVVTMNVIMFISISSRIISASSLMTAVPEPKDRGAFMSINSSIQQISGGVAASVAGMIVYQNADKTIENYNILAYVMIGTVIFTVIMMYYLNSYIKNRPAAPGFQPFNTQVKPEVATSK